MTNIQEYYANTGALKKAAGATRTLHAQEEVMKIKVRRCYQVSRLYINYLRQLKAEIQKTAFAFLWYN